MFEIIYFSIGLIVSITTLCVCVIDFLNNKYDKNLTTFIAHIVISLVFIIGWPIGMMFGFMANEDCYPDIDS